MFSRLAAFVGLIQAVYALPQANTATAPPALDTGVPSITLATAVASPTAPLTQAIPSQIPLPPTQPWCPSQIFCAGSLLQTVNVAALYPDQKTFVDKPTVGSSQQVLSDFQNITSSGTPTEGAVLDFVNSNFKGEGLELEAIAISNFNPNPAFLSNVSNPLVKAWSQTVHGYWTQLARNTNESSLCGGSNNCESTLIPLNHTFIVPGGRFREQYYWDSYWIIQGLIKSELFDLVKDTLENFMDELEHIGFIPNGGRIYYLNRSQPPLFIAMLHDYVAATKDTSILQRALPLAEKELAWWRTNRTIEVTSSYTNKTYSVARYAVVNSAPRPESYLTDYLTANDPELKTPLTEQQRADLYAELASGAESGWDYTARYMREPGAGGTHNTNVALRTLNIRSTIPIDLNSILYKAHNILADFYDEQNRGSVAAAHRQNATVLREAILDLFWDPKKLAFYDYNLTSNARNDFFSVATFFPLWNGIIPDELVSSPENAFGFFSTLHMVLNRYNGTYPTTFWETGLQWDAPNSWPNHQHVVFEALRALPANVTSGAFPATPSNESTYALIPAGQLGIAEDRLPGQPIIGLTHNASLTGPSADLNKLNGTVFNGGNATDGEGWGAALQRELANRYIASAFCSWHATGGSIPGVLPRLSDQELNITQSVNNTGNMFEKFSISDIDSAGRGGEYTVQAGFGWTNGVVLYVASVYGDVLNAPICPNLTESAATVGGGSGGSGDSGAASSLKAMPTVAVVVSVLASAVGLFF
ncbi:trehalase [Cristinia sonorae]|uniref:Trehalase n=1 Tax=Cristinia sonorae TaxID=1940300 RepID=A0A8K0UEQ7_9AGAR|nr:trehalase [Cristinia sonorae]